MKIFGLEGLPGSGKTTLLSLFPETMTEPEISVTMGGEERFPPLFSSENGKETVTAETVWNNQQFFLAQEEKRYARLKERKIPLVILDRTYLSQITFVSALCRTLALPDKIVPSVIDEIVVAIAEDRLYPVDLLITIDIPPALAYERVKARDGYFWGESIGRVLGDKKELFLQEREFAYRTILQSPDFHVLHLPYELSPHQMVEKIESYRHSEDHEPHETLDPLFSQLRRGKERD